MQFSVMIIQICFYVQHLHVKGLSYLLRTISLVMMENTAFYEDLSVTVMPNVKTNQEMTYQDYK